MPSKGIAKTVKAVIVTKKKRHSRVPRNTLSFFPGHRDVVLQYCDTYSGPSILGIGNVQFKLNSLHRVQGALSVGISAASGAVGHQPYYYDQIRPMYDFYTVTKTKILVEICNAGGATVCSLRDCDDNSSIPTNMQLERERPFSNIKTFIERAGSPARMSKTFDIAKVAGVPRSKLLMDPLYAGTAVISNDPTNIIYANLTCARADAVFNTPFDFLVTVKIIQHVRFFGVTQQPQS